MKSIFRTIALALALLTALSCNIDFLYLQLPGTSWSLEQGDTRAFVHFEPSGRVTIVQRNNASGQVQFTNGEYMTDGHSVVVSTDEGSSNKLVRTFSHLKSNSTNKNFSSLRPQSFETLSGSVWTSLKQDNLSVYFFGPEGKARHWAFENVRHEEGVPYGWSEEEETYSLSGSHVAMEKASATLFPEVMLVDDVWYVHFPTVESRGTSALEGTAWKFVTGSYPGILIFNTADTFTRVLVGSRILFQVSQGTYTQEGSEITFTLDGKTEICTLADNRFTFLERTYESF